MWESQEILIQEQTFFKRLLQNVAISSADEVLATDLLQKLSKASLSALWKSELLLKQPSTYFKYLSCNSMTELTYCCSCAADSLATLPEQTIKCL